MTEKPPKSANQTLDPGLTTTPGWIWCNSFSNSFNAMNSAEISGGSQCEINCKRDLKFNYSKHGKRKCTTLTKKNSRHAFLKRHKNFSGQKLFDTIFQVIFSGPIECFWKLPKALYSHLNFSLFFSGFTASYENIFLNT